MDQILTGRLIYRAFLARSRWLSIKVYIETPYFIPDESLIMALKTAALSGLDVRLIVQGIPDHKLSYWAMHSYFEELLQAGVKIFKYMKGILHAKILHIDDHLASVGSTNMDFGVFTLISRSVPLCMINPLAERLKIDFEQDLNDSSDLLFEAFKHRPVLDDFKN